MRALLPCLLLLPAAAAADGEWLFTFENGDRVRGTIQGIRNGTVLLALAAVPRAVGVPLREVASADPVPDPGRPAPAGGGDLVRLRDGGALLGRCRAIRHGQVEFEVEAIGAVSISGRDMVELLPAEDALRAYRRALGEGPGNPVPLPPERFDVLWVHLGRRDANLALQAHRELVRTAPTATPQLAARLRIQPDSGEVVDGWIAALEADAAEVRVLAHARLRSLGEVARPRLAAAARRTMSPEARQRVAALLAEPAADAPDPQEPDLEVLRFVRAIRVLEEIATPEARETLRLLANGGPDSATAREARSALERLRRAP
jgi:hypothetical protein